MIGRQRAMVLLALVAGCSSLAGDTTGVVAIEVVSPQFPTMEDRDTINLVTPTLHARALNLQGDSIDGNIKWTSADTLAVVIDSAIPYIVGAGTSGSPRIQARVGTLGSTVITYSLSARSDTIALTGSDSITVDGNTVVSDSLQVSLQSFQPAGPIANRRLIFTITSPAFATPADRTVEFPGHGLVDTATTGINGGPQTAVTLTRITGTIAPDSVVVTVTAHRPSGREVPGLVRPIVVHFEPLIGAISH